MPRLWVLLLLTVTGSLLVSGSPFSTGGDRWAPTAAAESKIRDVPGPIDPSTDTLRDVNRRVFRLTNERRTTEGLDEVDRDAALRRIACAHSRDMIRRDFFEHENPEGLDAGDRVARGHRRLVGEAGENLWGQTGTRYDGPEIVAERVVEQWMNSPPHRKNILRPQFTHMGVCVLQEGRVLRGTQVFAQVRAYLASPLPRTVVRGHSLPVGIGQTFPPGASIEKYDLWDPRAGERVAGPRAFRDTLRFPDATGTLRPRFYVPESGRYSVHQGPELDVAAP